MAISFDNPLDLYNTYKTIQTSSDKLSNSLDKDLTKATDEELMSVCKDFEAYFLEQVFKSMQKMVPEHEYESSSTKNMVEYFQDEMVSEYAKQATEGGDGKGLGLAQMLYEQMKRNIENV